MGRENSDPRSERFDAASIETIIGYRFRNRNLLKLAFTHRSVLSGHQLGVDQNYDRLEFEGDSVLRHVVVGLLCHIYPGADQGELSKRLSGFVSNLRLANICITLGLLPHIRVGDGSTRDNLGPKSKIPADVLEAIVGAIARDGGESAAAAFIQRRITPELSTAAPYGGVVSNSSAITGLRAAPSVRNSAPAPTVAGVTNTSATRFRINPKTNGKERK